ncbi:hypothetical protein G6L37_00970 [Agrobacterium rubi]|nr:hypothetical protein [Agrobacterium rubi]NTF23963.1 hypothetical protein [Agrobacterium rubi]
MNLTDAPVADPVLGMFDEDISGVLAEISEWLGIAGVSLQMQPSLDRHKASVSCGYSFTNEFYTTLHKGKAEYQGVPALKQEYVKAHVKAEADRLFGEAVSVDALRRDVLSGGLWSDSRVICEEIIATSYEDCNSCYNGSVSCGGCDGDGTQICNNCRLSSHARGYVTCWGCHGSGGGRDAGTGNWYTCSTCNGWKRVRCGTCGGSEKVRCHGCNGHGSVNCGLCAGHGFFTRAHGYRLSSASRGVIRSDTLPDMHVGYLGVWLKQGLPGRVAQKAGTALPCAEIDEAGIAHGGWTDGVFGATLSFDCHVTTGLVKSAYNGKPIGDVIYGRWDKPAVGFSPFLDHVVDDVLKVMVEKERTSPSEYLAAFSHIPGLVDGLRSSGSSADAKAGFLEAASKVLRNSVSAELVDIAVDGYLEAVGEMEVDVSGKVGRDVALAVCAAWIVGWLGGLFDHLAGLGNDYRLVAMVGLFLGVASVSAVLVKNLTRRRISAETGASAKYRLSALGKFLCLVGGVVFVAAGVLTVSS